jgi:hypothetical protein
MEADAPEPVYNCLAVHLPFQRLAALDLAFTGPLLLISVRPDSGMHDGTYDELA